MSNPIVHRSFSDGSNHLDDLFEAYSTIYQLPKFTLEDVLSDKSLFEYCQARRYFSLVLPYTNSGDLLLIPDLFTNHLTWKMHGGSVKSAESEDFVRAAERHARSSVPDISLGEVEPVALLENTFIYRGEIHTHSGIAFIGRIRNHHHPNVREALRSNPGRLVSYIDHTPKVEHSYHSEVLQCALPKIDLARRLTSQENEVEANERNIPRFELHNRIGKPLFRFFSYFFGETSIPSFERLTIEKALSKSASVDNRCWLWRKFKVNQCKCFRKRPFGSGYRYFLEPHQINEGTDVGKVSSGLKFLAIVHKS